MQGEVLGLNTWCVTTGQNLNFAISHQHITSLRQSNPRGSHPFDELPKRPQHQQRAAEPGDAARTMAYWNQLGAINRAFYNRLDGLRRPATPKDKSKEATYFKKLASWYKKLADLLPDTAKKIRALDIRGVDADLVLLATNDALSLDAVAETFQGYATKAEIGDSVPLVETAALNNKSYGAGNEQSDIGTRFEALRLALSTRYQKRFQPVLGDAFKPQRGAKAPSDDDEPALTTTAAGSDPAKAKQAANKLKLAKQLLKSKPAAAKEKLQKIIADFPDTKAADEAKTLLEELDSGE